MMFLNEAALILLASLPIYVILFVWRGWVRRHKLSQIGDPDLVSKLVAQVSPLRRGIKALLWSVSLACVIVAAARPTWGEEQEIITYEGVQILFAIDVSRSMDVDDIRPSRLLRARFDLTDMMTALEDNDMGMVLFAGTAFTYMPMTNDLDAALLFLEDLSTNAISLQGTNFVAAIAEGLDAFNQTTQAQQIMVLISDGEHHEDPIDPILDDANTQGVIIHTIGYGTVEGGRVPVYDSLGQLVEYKTSPNGTLVNAALDERPLIDIARATGGIFIRAGSGDDVLSPIIEAIQSTQSGEIGERIVRQPAERSALFAGLALLFLTLDIILPESRRRRI